MNLKRYDLEAYLPPTHDNRYEANIVEMEDGAYYLASEADAAFAAERLALVERAEERLKGMAEHAMLEGDELNWWNDKPHQVLWHLVKDRKTLTERLAAAEAEVERLKAAIDSLTLGRPLKEFLGPTPTSEGANP